MNKLFELAFSVDNDVRCYKKSAVVCAPQLDIAINKAIKQIREADGTNCEIALIYHKSYDTNEINVWISSAEEPLH